MRPLLLSVAVLCLWGVAQVRTEDDPNGLRLCGRAFLRAVVYTCGGSRWRRQKEDGKTLSDGKRDPNLSREEAAPRGNRFWRDQSQAIISMCCQVGCHKSDLLMLC